MADYGLSARKVVERTRKAAAELLYEARVDEKWPQRTDAFIEAHRVKSMLIRRLRDALDTVPGVWLVPGGLDALELAAAIEWKLRANAAVAEGGAEAAPPPFPPLLLAKYPNPPLSAYVVVEHGGQQRLALRWLPSSLVVAREDWCEALVHSMGPTFGNDPVGTRKSVRANPAACAVHLAHES